MTRENSSFKFGRLLAKCCRRQAALITLAMLSLIAALPVSMILGIHSTLRYRDNNDPETCSYVLQEIKNMLYAGAPSSLVLVALGVIAGIALFRFLHVRSQTDFFHALPVTRGQMFCIRTLTGLIAVVPAYLISFALVCAVCAAYGYADALNATFICATLLSHLAGFLLVYALSILAAVLCGNTLVSLLLCGWLQFGLFAGWFVVYSLLYVFYPAHVPSDKGFPEWLSPPMQTYGVTRGTWDADLDVLHDCVLPSLGYLIAAVVVLALCLALYRIRRSENTGLAVAFPVIQLPLKLYMLSVGGVACGLVFETTTSNWKIMFFGMALGAVVVSGVAEIVYDLDFHSLFHRWKSTIVYGALCAVVLGCMAADITGWNSALPDRDDIIAAGLSSDETSWDCEAYNSDNASYSVYFVDEGEEQTDSLMESDEVLDAIYNSAQIGAQAMTGDRSTIREGVDYNNMSYTVTFTLEDGKTFRRRYYMPYGTEALEDNGAAVRFSQEYLSTRTVTAQAQAREDEVTQILVGNYLDVATRSLTSFNKTKAIKAILDTLQEESLSLTAEYVAQNAPVLVLRAVIPDEEYGVATTSYLMDLTYGFPSYYDIPIYACETDTIAMLAEQIDGLETGFGSANVTRIKVTTYDYDTGDEMSEIYTEEDEIAAWLEELFPTDFHSITDPVYHYAYNDITVTLDDGTMISCDSREED